MELPERGERMLLRVATAARRLRLPPADESSIDAAVRVALEVRAAALEEDDPSFLHPARTALILLEDVRLTDPVATPAAALIDSLDPERSAKSFDLARSRLEPVVVELALRVPTPATAGEELAEALVLAEPAARLIALAERLDHARHLHLRPGTEWRPIHESVRSIYAPLAERTEPTLARRFRWWTDMFARQYLG